MSEIIILYNRNKKNFLEREVLIPLFFIIYKTACLKVVIIYYIIDTYNFWERGRYDVS